VIIDIHDPRVEKAIELVKLHHTTKNHAEFENVFEEKYHCKIEIDEPLCNEGRLIISEEKYQNWFLIQFGDASE
jgi:hypothetical protein